MFINTIITHRHKIVFIMKNDILKYVGYSKAKYAFTLTLTISIIALSINLSAQNSKTLKNEFELQTNLMTSSSVPFWLRSNQFGSIPLKQVSGAIIFRSRKDYKIDTVSKHNLIDWAFGFEGRLNGGSSLDAKLIEGYIKGKLSIFEMKLGRSKDVMGLTGDTALSSGSFAMSGNALGIPKIEISIPEYYTIPILNRLLAIKGTFSHGFLGKTQILNRITYSPNLPPIPIQNSNPISYLHQKSLYGRFGKENWRLKLYGGFNHQVYWGNEQSAYGPNFKLDGLQTFFHVITGKAYGAPGVPTSKIGNQLGSIDLGVEYEFKNYIIMIYRQNLYDVGALSKLANIADGLNGIAITNKLYNKSLKVVKWQKALFEVLYTKNQAGYPWSKFTKSGDEDYYNNFYYIQGWSYNDLGLGNPFITRRDDAKDGQASRPSDYFINNRVLAIHTGIKGQIYDYNINAKISYSRNYGTFGTSKYGKSTGTIRDPQSNNIFIPADQFSFYLEGAKKISMDTQIGLVLGADTGDLLDDSFGISLRFVRKL